MWWNRSKTPQRTDSGQIRELSQRVAEMESDFEKVFNLIAKINGRLRQRERRADAGGDGEDTVTLGDGSDVRPEFVAPIPAKGEHRSSDSPVIPPSYSKDQLRQLARSRGLLPQ